MIALATETQGEIANKNKNPMQKIILLVGVAIIAFIAFIAYSLQTSIKNSEQLATIKDLYFPVLERIDSNIVHLDKIEERLMQAVMTGESEELDIAKNLHTESDKVFAEMASIYVAQQTDIVKLQTEFHNYFDLAHTTSKSLMENGGQNNTEQSAKMNQLLTDLRQHLREFHQASYGKFVNTLEESQKAASLSMYMGIAVGLMNLCFMAVLVYFIRNNIKMMAVIAEQNATLENRVAERTQELNQKTHDINAMLHNMSLGVCTVVAGNRIHPEYSEYLQVIVGHDKIANQNVLSSIFSLAKIGVDTKDQIAVALEAILGEDPMMFDFNGHLLIPEMQLTMPDGQQKILQMSWSPIINDEIVEKVLLIIQDVTALRELELASAHQKEELDIIAKILKVSVGKFNEFIVSTQKFLAENRKLLEQNKSYSTDVIAALFRNMHTIKGNARTYEFNLITDVAHVSEQEYDRLRKGDFSTWDSDKMLDELAAVENAVSRYIQINEDKLGRKGRAADTFNSRGCFVPNEELISLKKLAGSLINDETNVELISLRNSIDQMGLISLNRIVSGVVDSISSLAKELKKPIPRFKVKNSHIAFNTQFSEVLKSSFMHIIRNSLDHGIESPEERVEKQKSEQGLIFFICEHNDGNLELHIGDDGRGLALHKLYEKGCELGIFTEFDKPTANEVADLIFNSGLSTATEVTQISGRGVGMDAVKSFLKEKGAHIDIVLNKNNGEFKFTPFKFVIYLPSSATSYL